MLDSLSQNRISPVGSRRDEIRRAYVPTGSAKAQIRRNQLLPLHWRHLTPGDIWEISSQLWAAPAADATEVELEAMLAIAAILTTGRNLGRLHHLKLYKNSIIFKEDGSREGVVRLGSDFCWHVFAGSPSRQISAGAGMTGANEPRRMEQAGSIDAEGGEGETPRKRYRKAEHAQSRPASDPQDRVIKIPIAPLVRVWLKRCQIKGANKPKQLFRHPIEKLIPTIEHFLATRRGLGVARPRRCSTTLESITRFLVTEMTFQAGADIATAARLTDSAHPSSKSVIYYGTSRSRDLGRKVEKATACLALEKSPDVPLDPEWQSIGSLIAPLREEVEKLIEFLKSDLEESRLPEARHRAMVMQTVALVSFATGHRCHGSYLPSTAAIDPHTGFCRVNEKYPDDRSEFRMIWVPLVARQQILTYELYLASLEGQIPADTYQSSQRQVAMGRLPFFQLGDGPPVESTLTATWLDLAVRAPQFNRMAVNSGRHWLRGELEGKCSTETLHALFGHWDIGTEPWSYGSCLDPIIYREDLARTVPACLASVGWKDHGLPVAARE
jgi:hypothetical protein